MGVICLSYMWVNDIIKYIICKGDAMAEEQKNEQPVENKEAEAPKKEQKPVNYKTKYIILGVLIAVLVVAVVLCIVFLGNPGGDETTSSFMALSENIEQVTAGNSGIENVTDIINNIE